MKGCNKCPAFAKCTVSYRGSACDALRASYGVDSDPEIITNADKIRAMTDEELRDFLWKFNEDSFENVLPFCKSTPECDELLDSDKITEEMCKQCLLQKLLQPYDRANH